MESTETICDDEAAVDVADEAATGAAPAPTAATASAAGEEEGLEDDANPNNSSPRSRCSLFSINTNSP